MEAVAPASPAWVKERREAAAKRFAETGYPTTRQEDWRFTNVAPIADAKFPVASGAFARAAALVAGVGLRGSVRLAIVNGEFNAGLSDLSALPRGLRIAGLRDGGAQRAGPEPAVAAPVAVAVTYSLSPRLSTEYTRSATATGSPPELSGVRGAT